MTIWKNPELWPLLQLIRSSQNTCCPDRRDSFGCEDEKVSIMDIIIEKQHLLVDKELGGGRWLVWLFDLILRFKLCVKLDSFDVFVFYKVFFIYLVVLY